MEDPHGILQYCAGGDTLRVLTKGGFASYSVHRVAAIVCGVWRKEGLSQAVVCLSIHHDQFVAFPAGALEAIDAYIH
jgi:hypothetical protein